MVDYAADFLAALDFFGDPQLTAGAVSSLDEDHLVTLAGCSLGGLHSRRAGADDHDASPEGRLQEGADSQFPFIAGGRIMHARGVGDVEQSVDAALVTADAAADFLGPAFAHLVDGFGIGDLLARHGDHIGVAELQDVGGVIRIIDASDCDDRDVDD